jgi:putative CocE/NonD family hydrolase
MKMHSQYRCYLARLYFSRYVFLVLAVIVSAMISQVAVAESAGENSVYPSAHLIHNVKASMRDGTMLAADVYLPARNGKKVDGAFPTLVERTPYGKSGEQASGIYFARHGYAVVIQDVRGRNASEGTFYPYIHEAKDGYDTVEWAAKQPWSNGKVGTFGISYMAATQMLMVHNEELPPHLVAMAPGYASASYYGDGAYTGGAFKSAHNLDYESNFAVAEYDKKHGTEDQMTPLKRVKEAVDQLYWRIPLRPFKPLANFPAFDDYMEHNTYDDYWSALNDIPFYNRIDIPVLSFGGWFDLFDQGTVQNYVGSKKAVANEGENRQPQLVMGPYIHGKESLRAQGMMSGMPRLFAKNATYARYELYLAWFDKHLKGKDVFNDTPPVRLYIPGGGFNQWIGASDFPVPEAKPPKYYIHSSGRASIGNIDTEHLAYDGILTQNAPTEVEPTDKYVYDPMNPVITIEGYDQHWAGGTNQETKMYQDHKDVLVYETPLLKHDTAVVGPITMTLYASTSAPTTDFMVNLSDVDPTGHVEFVAEGLRRGGVGDVSADPRNPKSYSEVNPLVPGQVYEWKISIWPTAHVFAKNHKIRIDITSSDFPRVNRNLNTSPDLTTTKVAKADQTIYHTKKYPSHVTLPMLSMSDLKDMVIDAPTPENYPQHGDKVYLESKRMITCMHGESSQSATKSGISCSGGS